MLNDAGAASQKALAKKILMTADAVGDTLTYALALAAELTRAGAEVHLATMGPKLRAAQEARVRSIPGLVLHESTFALEWMEEPWADVARAADWLRGLEKSLKPDIVHLNGYAHGAAGFDAPVVIAAHSCLRSWWDAAAGGPTPERYTAYEAAVKRGLGAAAAVITASSSMHASLQRYYGPLPRTAVVPNGLNAPSSPSSEREPYVLSRELPWDRAEDVAVLGHVASRISWPLKVIRREAGSASSPQEGAGLESLTWMSPDEQGALMDRASIFLLAAKYEPFGLCALDAALRGCALVLADIPSLREVWGDAAVYVPPGDAAAVAEAITRLEKDSNARSELAAAANLRARLYTPARNARAMRDVYETILQVRRAPAPQAHGRESRTA